jgi:carbonic anhydrase
MRGEALRSGTPGETLVKRVAEQNVRLALQAIPQHSTHLHRLVNEGKVGLAGAMYDVRTAEVRFLE